MHLNGENPPTLPLIELRLLKASLMLSKQDGFSCE